MTKHEKRMAVLISGAFLLFMIIITPSQERSFKQQLKDQATVVNQDKYAGVSEDISELMSYNNYLN